MPDRKPNNIALIGNPNVGKTSIFNLLTQEHQQVSNWSGSTVKSFGKLIKHNNIDINILDLPGIDDLTLPDSVITKDQLATKQYLKDNDIDLIVNVVDANFLEKNLYLTLQLLELKIPVIVIINKIDSANNNNLQIKHNEIAKHLGCPTLPFSATKTQTNSLDIIKNYMLNPKVNNYFKVTYDAKIEQQIQQAPQANRFLSLLKVVNNNTVEDADMLVATARYDASSFITSNYIKHNKHKSSKNLLDSLFLHKYLGVPLFFLIMYSVLMCSIATSNIFINFFDIMSSYFLVDYSGFLLNGINAPPFLIDLLCNGVGRGLQTVITFVPVILSLFFYLSLLESSGYLSRAEFLIDAVMRRIGLPGKAFIPMILGFGCSVPAIMATRRLSGSNERIIVGMMSPFMSCGARLPTYTMFATAFFYEHASYMVMSLYLVGILAAIGTGLLLKNIIYLDSKSNQIIEFSDYQLPSVVNNSKRAIYKTKKFIKESSMIIVLVTTCLSLVSMIEIEQDDKNVPLLEVAAKGVSPVFSPFGIEEDNWQAVVGIITGLFAKEVIIGSLSELYATSLVKDKAPAKPDFQKYFQQAVNSVYQVLPFVDVSNNLDLNEDSTVINLQKNFKDPLSAFAYLLFILLYTPCITAVFALKKEFGCKWAAFSSCWSLLLAYTVAIFFYTLVKISSDVFASGALLAFLVLLWVLLYNLLKKIKIKNNSISIVEID